MGDSESGQTLKTRLQHATTVCIDGRAVVLRGPSGSGKTMLGLALIAEAQRTGHQAALVCDDQTLLVRTDEKILARAPDALVGKVELRGLGVVDAACSPGPHPVGLVADLVDREPERWQLERSQMLLGVPLPFVELPAHDRWRSCLICLALLAGPPAIRLKAREKG